MSLKSMLLACVLAFLLPAVVLAQPSYSKQVRPILTKYCLECHNAKEMKGTLSLETYKAMMEGADGGPILKAGKPDESKLVLLCEGKQKPTMPPAKAKYHPSKDEIALLRAWVAAGAKDDGAEIKVVLPDIKAKTNALPPVTALTYSSKSKKLYIANADLFLLVVDFSRAEPAAKVHGGNLSLMGPKARMNALSSSPSSNLIVAGIGDQGAPGSTVWITSDGIALSVDQTHSDAILDVATDPKCTWTASAGYDSNVVLKSNSKRHILKEHSDAVYGLAFNPDGTLLASVSADRAMKVFDVEKGKLLYTLGDATDWLYAVAWSPDGKYLVSGGVDKSIRVYEPTPTGAKLRQSVFAHEGAVQKLVFASDSKTLYSVGQDRVVKAWDIEKMVERKVYDKQPETVLCLALREDAGQIIVGRYDGIVQLIDMKTGKVAHEFGKVPAKPRDERSDSRGSGSLDPQESLRSSLGLTAVKGAPGASPATGQKIALPAFLAGTLDRAGAVHFFRFNVDAGQSLGIHLQTTELKSKVEGVLALTDMKGRVLAESYDGLLGHTFADAGTYAISMRDRQYRGGADFTYRLRLGDIPIVTAVFPMGAPRGANHEFQVEGVFLPKRMLSYFIPATAKPGDVLPLDFGAGTKVLGKAQVIAGEYPEVSSVGKLPVPGTANGRILKDNQRDVWTFSARKGNQLVVEVNARRIGSRLDSVIEILDASDKPVPRAVLRSQAKTNVTFRDHDSAQGNIRIEAWGELTTNDFLYVGNELMKIQALPTHPDADCNFFATAGQRIGYLDTTPTHHANGTPMYKVSLHPPGTSFPPNGYPLFTLYYQNDDGGPGFGRDSRLIFDPPADGSYKVRISDARGMSGANFGYRLTVRHPKPHFTLNYAPAKPALPRGSAIPITFTADRIDGFDGPITIRAKNLPAGLHLPETTIEAGTYNTTVALYADADAKLPEKAAIQLEGSTYATGLPYSFIRPIELPKLLEPGDLVTTVQEAEVALKPGGQAKMTVHIERRNGFKGRVPLDVKGLPHGVRVLDIGLNGILVNEAETTRTVVLYAEPWVRAQDHPFVVLARREGKGTEHGAKSVLLRVK